MPGKASLSFLPLLALLLWVGWAAALPALARENGGTATQGKPCLRVARAPCRAEHRGNLKSRKFHRSTCRYFNCKNCLAVFESREAALQAGFVPCKVCRP